MSLNVRRHRRLLGLALRGAVLNASPAQVRAALRLRDQVDELRLALRRAGLLGRGERLTELQVTGLSVAACLNGHWTRLSGAQLQRWDGAAWVEAQAAPMLGLAPAAPAPLTERDVRALFAPRDGLQFGTWTPLVTLAALTASVGTLMPVPLGAGVPALLALAGLLNSPALMLMMLASLLFAREALIRLRTLDLAITGAHLAALAQAASFTPAWHAPLSERRSPVMVCALEVPAQTAATPMESSEPLPVSPNRS